MESLCNYLCVSLCLYWEGDEEENGLFVRIYMCLFTERGDGGRCICVCLQRKRVSVRSM